MIAERLTRVLVLMPLSAISLFSQNIPPRPPEAPATLRALIGMYVRAADTLTFLEDGGRLVLHGRGPGIAATSSEGWIRYAVGGDTVFFRNDAGEVQWRGASYRRLNIDRFPFRVHPVRPLEDLRTEAEQSTPPLPERKLLQPELSDVTAMDTTIRLDVRYATDDNFLGARVYSRARAVLQRPAALALVRSHRWLAQFGYGLLIHDAYRPWSVTKIFWEATPPSQRAFVANPTRGSKHNRGCAVDLTLYDLRTEQAVEMPSAYDEFSVRAYTDHPGGTGLQRWHRLLLRTALEREGFTPEIVEWWHFDYHSWERYPVLNIPFEHIP